eukprot:TRINITY_DN10043_c1_g1_i2.p1 TRINITY_DN10043_c1_g1~~TRINITY_DN10043_c1_g1_i2.p1  ORF type:complete len:219 (-),score=3.90 TRINITY_DN10043_c1_g1_i2:31-687(-)
MSKLTTLVSLLFFNFALCISAIENCSQPQKWIPSLSCFYNSEDSKEDKPYEKCQRQNPRPGCVINALNSYQHYNTLFESHQGLFNFNEPTIVQTMYGTSLFCVIPKAGSTTWRRIILKGKLTHVNIMKMTDMDIYYKWRTEFKQLSNESSTRAIKIMNSPNIIRWVIVRNPYARVYSAYRDKFVKTTYRQKQSFQKLFGFEKWACTKPWGVWGIRSGD